MESDIDECQDSKTCPLKTTICKNIPGSYACECLPEYDVYGSDCTGSFDFLTWYTSSQLSI